MDKIILKAQNREELDQMIKRTITLAEDETVRVNVISEPKKILFFKVNGTYEIEIIKKSELKEKKEEKINSPKKQQTKVEQKKEVKTEKKSFEKHKEKKENKNNEPKKEIKVEKIKEENNKVVENKEENQELKQNYDKIRSFVKEFIVHSKLDITIVNIEKVNDRYIVNLDGKDIRYLIGEKGATLNSLEYLLSSVKQFKNIKINIDSNNYKDKREEALRDLARKKGKKVLESGKMIKLNPMSARERKIIHEEISYIKGLETESVGEEPKRCLVIKKVRKNKDK